jgi:hypothetical protein
VAVRRTLLLGVALVAVATSAVSGSGGVFAAADRSVDVDVEAADEAYVGVEAWTVERSANATRSANASAETALAVRFENRVGGDAILVVVAEAGDGQPARVELPPGGTETVRFEGADCETVVSVRATTPDGDVSVAFDRRTPCREW